MNRSDIKIVGNGLYYGAPVCPCCLSSKDSDLCADNYNQSLATMWKEDNLIIRTLLRMAKGVKAPRTWICRACFKENRVVMYKTPHMSLFRSCPFCKDNYECVICSNRRWLRL